MPTADIVPLSGKEVPTVLPGAENPVRMLAECVMHMEELWSESCPVWQGQLDRRWSDSHCSVSASLVKKPP